MSTNQIVLLPEIIQSERMQQLPTMTRTEANKQIHRLLLEKPSSQNTPLYADKNITIPQIAEVQQRVQH